MSLPLEIAFKFVILTSNTLRIDKISCHCTWICRKEKDKQDQGSQIVDRWGVIRMNKVRVA